MPSHKLLLVDDNDAVLKTLALILAKNDFEVTVASNAPEALKKISEGSFDVLLSDLHMPNARRWPHRGQRHAPRQSDGP